MTAKQNNGENGIMGFLLKMYNPQTRTSFLKYIPKYKGELMNMPIILIVALFLLAAASPQVSAVVPDLKIGAIHNQADSPEIPYSPSLPIIFKSDIKSDLPSDKSSRIGIVSGNVTEYKIRVNVGPGEYDYITLTNYVQEKSPWRINTDRNLIILPGHALTEKFYSDMAIYYAQHGYSTYILDRRETSVSPDETDFSFMKTWTVDEYLRDTYQGINASRRHTALLSSKPAESIEVTAIGHSHGALLLTAYEASEYDDLSSGSVDRLVPVDIIIAYKPENSQLIQNQLLEFNSISESIETGGYVDDSMANMIWIAYLASADPEADSLFYPGLTNRQFFRLMASQTYIFYYYPYTPYYHYWTGDPDGLYYVDENRLLNLTLTGGAVLYTPKYLDQYMAGLMGNVEGYKINSSRIDSPVLYVGLGGGFDDYGAWWYKNEVGKTNSRVTSVNWNDQGHGSLLIDYNSPEVWALIDNWIRNNKISKK